MAFDYKKEYKDIYAPKTEPSIIEVPDMQYLAVRGKGDPNDPAGAYNAAVGMLYAVAYTLKMSYKGDRKIDGYFEYVVPPLEGFWWQEGVAGVDYSNKAAFSWISVIRLPDFFSQDDVDWAIAEAARKKSLDCTKVELLHYAEGLCVQCMHLGLYDDEPATVERMDAFAAQSGYVNDFSDVRHHHEVYLSDPRKAAPDKLRTIIRHPLVVARDC